MTTGEVLLRAIAWIAGSLAMLGCFYLAAACLLVLKLRRQGQGGEAETKTLPAVTVLVPLCGAEPGLASRLRRLRRQRYPAAVEIVCGVRSESDTAIPLARSVAAEGEGWPLALSVAPRTYGRNLKISNLINMMGQAHHTVVVMIDSDMEVSPDYLAKTVAQLAEPGVGAVTSLYTGVPLGGLAARLSAMSINLDFLPNVVVGMALGMAHPCFGATIAMSRDELDRIGGLQAFADQLWDDYAIGRAVRATGRELAVETFAPAHVCTESSARRLFATQLRAARTIRSVDPAGHAGAVLTHPFPLALVALLLAWAWWTLMLAAAALGLRMMLGLAVMHRFGAPRPAFALVPLRDLLSFAVYVASYLGSSVEWRGERYRVQANGTLTPTAHRG